MNVTATTTLASVRRESSGIQDCPVCVIFWLFLKKFADVIIAVLVSGALFIIIGLALFCWYRRKMRRRIQEITRRENNNRNNTPRPLSQPNEYDNTPHQPQPTYEELGNFELPSSITSLSIPDIPGVAGDKNQPGMIMVPERDNHRISPLPDTKKGGSTETSHGSIGIVRDTNRLSPFPAGGTAVSPETESRRLLELAEGDYLHPTPEPVRKAKERMVDYPYSSDSGGGPSTDNQTRHLITFKPGRGGTSDQASSRADDYLNPDDNPDEADGIRSPIWHTDIDNPGHTGVDNPGHVISDTNIYDNHLGPD